MALRPVHRVAPWSVVHQVTKFLKAVDKTIVMGYLMYGNLLKAAAEAHHEAIGSSTRRA